MQSTLSPNHSARLVTPPETENLLHDPSQTLRCLDEHIISAARLSRAMWLALDGKEDHVFDERDRLALYELASEIAHHASAADHLIDKR